jgi:uncharacterized protein (DUF1015 family)
MSAASPGALEPPRLASFVVSDHAANGLSLAAFRGLRFTADESRLGRLLCPPYDVIDADTREALIESDADNVVRIVLPVPQGGTGAPDAQYAAAAELLSSWVADGVLAVDTEPTLYVYEMSTSPGDAANVDPDSSGAVTRGLLGAIELRAPEDGVILPHENTMAGPVADRLALMEATEANLEPIYLVYDGGGAASELVASVGDPHPAGEPGRPDTAETGVAFVTSAVTPDGTRHRLWAVTDPTVLADVADDLSSRHALIADGHHRYATYRQLADRRRTQEGHGPWDRGLALLVDSSAYGPEVHPIHRTVPGLSFRDAIARAATDFEVSEPGDLDATQARLDDPAEIAADEFAVVLTDGHKAVIVSSPRAEAVAAARRAEEPEALSALDVWVLHRVLIERTWALVDDEQTVHYAHSVPEAVVERGDGVALLLRATPVAAVAAVAAAGARMPRKSTLFTPKPASGMVMRRFVDQT